MIQNKIAAVLLMMSAVIFMAVVLLVEKVSDFGLTLGAIAITAAGAFFVYLYTHRFSNTKRWLLLFLMVVPSLILLLRSLFKM